MSEPSNMSRVGRMNEEWKGGLIVYFTRGEQLVPALGLVVRGALVLALGPVVRGGLVPALGPSG